MLIFLDIQTLPAGSCHGHLRTLKASQPHAQLVPTRVSSYQHVEHIHGQLWVPCSGLKYPVGLCHAHFPRYSNPPSRVMPWAPAHIEGLTATCSARSHTSLIIPAC